MERFSITVSSFFAAVGFVSEWRVGMGTQETMLSSLTP